MVWLATAVAALALCWSSSSAMADPPPLFTQFPQNGTSGSGAGQLGAPLGVASDPANGQVYVAEGLGGRISEFTAWGEFIKAWGWGVDDGASELQVCSAASTCGPGLEGSGPGQLEVPMGVAVDASGAIYVVDSGNHRVQKFNSAGEFVLMFGGEVDKTTNADVCTKVSGDECGVGVVGSGPGEFGDWVGGDYIDVAPDGTIFVGDEGRIQKFDSSGVYESEIPLPEARATKSLAIDPTTGAVYVSLNQSFFFEVPEVPVFYELNPTTGAIIEEIEVGDPDAAPFPLNGFAEALATDTEGHVYVAVLQKQTTKQNRQEVLEFEADGTCLICAGEGFSEPPESTGLAALATSSACGVPSDALYVAQFGAGKAFVRAFGPTPDPAVCPPPPVPPQITAQYAVSVSAESALVRAQINPRFWADTTYYVEYGTADCSLGGCRSVPVPPGTSLGGPPVNIPLTTAGVSLPGLEPATEYHFRFVAQSGGGGPVKGIGGEVGADGAESTFRTFPLPQARAACPVNQQFRIGRSALLPDCRAYEMVSPVDKSGGDIVPLRTINAYPAGLAQSSLDGNGLTYSSYRAFGNSKAAPYTSQYLARRDPSAGWSSEALAIPREGESFFNTAGLEVQYKAFSPDLCQGWVLQDAEPTLTPAAPAGFADLYRWDGCAGGAYEALNQTVPTLTGAADFMPTLQGVSTDGRCAVFRADDKLTPDASSNLVNGIGVYQLYEACDGKLRLVSVLPNGTANSSQSSAGTGDAGDNNRTHNVWHAVSPDGSRIYWTAFEGAGPGRIYVRDNAEQEPSALVNGDECTEPAKACTYPVSELVSGANAQFWGAAPDGSVAIFSIGANLYEFDFASKQAHKLAGQFAGWLGGSDDVSRIYFASEENRAAGATAGQLNLYRFDRGGGGGGTFAFVATLSSLDNQPGDLSPIAKRPVVRTSRVSPDGDHVAFSSRSKALSELTADFDNTDANSDEPDTEVYLYNAAAGGGAGSLACVSCNPTGARPSGRELVVQAVPSGIWAAAQLPGWENQLYAERALAADGSRLFFDSFEALELRDTNGKQDAYEWEAAGVGDCDAADPTFDAGSGGCVNLISGGEGEDDSAFVDATPSGADAFFATESSLVPQDAGSIDVYDARVNGGFPPPPASPPPCEGDACQGPPPTPPKDPNPASSAVRPSDNLPSRRCPKGKRRVVRKGQVRCVHRHKKQHHEKHRGKKRQHGVAR
jgi:DNA-binding beta-propeller fold protein YncE